jgi:hypothetical protein
MTSYKLTSENIQREYDRILQILHIINKYNKLILRTVSTKKGHKHREEKTKWVRFTYVGRETMAITKLFKNTNIKIKFSTDNALKKLLATKHEHTRSKYDNSGIYQLTCPTCNMKYTGQARRPFKVCLRERFRDYKYGSGKPKFAAHLSENKHSTGPMENIMETLHIRGKG